MKKVIFIFLILISCLCLAVVSCADKEESSTSSSSTDTTTDGYMKNGNMLMVWGTGTTDGNGVSKTVNFPVSFSETPSVTANTIYSRSLGSSSEDELRINSVTKSTTFIYISASKNFNYIAIGKWQ